MDQFFDQIKQDVPGVEVKQDAPIFQLTAFKTGGPARFLVSLDTLENLAKTTVLAWKYSVPVRIIGGGTNVLIPEDGFDGLVIKNNCRKFDLQGMKGKFINNQMKFSHAYLYAESGAITNQVVRYVLDQGFGGLEYALGLPGTVGGAVAVNANFSKENVRISKAVYTAKILTEDGIVDVDNSYFRFGDDESRLLGDRQVLLSVLFSLTAGDKKELWEQADAAVAYRTTTQPKMLMTGMTFRNIKITNLYPNSSLPKDVTCEFLFEKAGLLGYRVGDVELWNGNPRYIINRGNGTVADVEKMISHLRETIFRKFGVQLEMQLHKME